AALERGRAQLRDAWRSLVHGEIAADAMAGAVVEIDPRLPQIAAREGIELGAGRGVGKYGARERNVALEHEREARAHLRSRLTDGNGAGNVRGAILILAAGIDEEQLAGHDRAIGARRHTIMHDGPVGPRACNG